jgi:opacity protein-like surface antigen
MVKRSMKVLMLFSALTTIMAEEVKQTSSMAGAYIGIQMGLSHSAYRVRCGYFENAGGAAVGGPFALTDGRAADVHNKRFGKNAFIAGIMTGYGLVHNDVIYTGIEMTISAEGKTSFTTRDNYPTIGPLLNTNISKISYQRGIALGVGTRFGYIINQWMPFLKLGVSISRDTIKQTLDTNMEPLGPLLTTNQYKCTKTVPSFTVGGGVDYQFSNHWIGRLTYEYRVQDTVKLPEIRENAAAGGGGPYTGTLLKNIRNHTLQFGIVYKF